jgi:hypothetical protein
VLPLYSFLSLLFRSVNIHKYPTTLLHSISVIHLQNAELCSLYIPNVVTVLVAYMNRHLIRSIIEWWNGELSRFLYVSNTIAVHLWTLRYLVSSTHNWCCTCPKAQRIMGSSSEYITDDFNVAALRSGTTAMEWYHIRRRRWCRRRKFRVPHI